MKSTFSEKYLERKLREGVKERGGLAVKFQSSSFTGLPDRLIVLPGMGVMWVELKSTGKRPSAEQEERIKLLRDMEHRIYVIDSINGVDEVLLDIDEYISASDELERNLDRINNYGGYVSMMDRVIDKALAAAGSKDKGARQ